MRHIFICLMLVVNGYALHAAGPVAKNDSASVQENSQVTIAVTANDVDTNGGTLAVTITQLPNHGSAVRNGQAIIYRPQQNFFGEDSLQYSVCDTFNFCATAEVYILVRGTNLSPIINSATYTFNDTVHTVVLNVLGNDTDPGNDTLYILSTNNIDTTINLGGLSIDSSSHQVVFTHNLNTCGTEVFEYTACNIAKCDSALITINITCPDSIFLPQGFSPNGDGKNDFLVFPGLEYFSPATLNVFNRYGTSVYQSGNYLNNWNGTDSDSNHPLPDGTYFYILTLPSGKTYNNFVVINR
jgi:gliding motility-associated-like protein